MSTKYFLLLVVAPAVSIAIMSGCQSNTAGLSSVAVDKANSTQVASTKPSKADMEAMLRNYPTAAYAAARAQAESLEREAKAAMAAGHFAQAYAAYQSEKPSGRRWAQSNPNIDRTNWSVCSRWANTPMS